MQKVVTDPFDPKALGLELPKQEADIVTMSHGQR
ncbi:MAG: MBL fold metallo-hydrolase [Saprospiraceae bacterium]|nr:MBL fold metallo-hydrolase [Candidatus Brachybacter algidus]